MDNIVIKENDNFNNDEIKNLKKMINQLHENEHIEIFKIIKNDTDKYTENRNGIFINNTEVMVEDIIIKSKRYVIASGSSPLIPDIKGINNVNYYFTYYFTPE